MLTVTQIWGDLGISRISAYVNSSVAASRGDGTARSTVRLFKSGDRRRKGKEPNSLYAFPIFPYFGLEMHQRNMNKEKIGCFYLRKQALFTFTLVNSVWKIKASLSGRACWWPPLSLSTVPLMGIYSSEDHQPGVILCFPDLNIFLSLSGSSCLFPFSRWGRRLVWETTVIPSAILTFLKLILHNGSIQIRNA